MKPRIVTLLIAAVVLAVSLGLWSGGWGDSPPRRSLPASKPAVTAAPVASAPPPTVIAPPAPLPPAPAPAPDLTQTAPGVKIAGSAAPGALFEAPSSELHAQALVEIDKVGLMFRDYRTLMGSNPIGTNAEIIKAVSGGNPKKAQLGPPEGQQINAKGELVDAWGTAYFFHQQSATDMEIHSAGPDKKFATTDDIIGR